MGSIPVGSTNERLSIVGSLFFILMRVEMDALCQRFIECH